mmetsp:Transcript_4549/g.9295  ORF Transcript_4549/g.9295 Transcript_4549/m.9295 type:complete len:140 (+) Transcript_4549:106-525(+)
MPVRDNDAKKSPGDDNRRLSAISNFLFRRRKSIEESQENISIVHKTPEFKPPTPNSDSFSSARTQTSEDASREEKKVEAPSRREEDSFSTRSMGDHGDGDGVVGKSPIRNRSSIDWDERIEAMRQRQRDNSAPNPFAFF